MKNLRLILCDEFALSRQRAKGIGAIILTVGCFVLSTRAQTLIYQESFESDGEGTRYTSEGHLVSEPANHEANAVPLTQLGPVYWARRSEVSFVGVPGATPARRALLAWDGNIATNEISPQFFSLFEATVKWLVKDMSGATVVFSPNQAAAQSLADRLGATGYSLVDDDAAVADTNVVADAVIKGPGSDGSRFGLTRISVLTFLADSHDDLLVSSIGATATFEAGNATILTNHPAAGGLTGSFPVATNEHIWQLIGTQLPDGAITIANFIQFIAPTAASLADVDAMVAGTKQSIPSSGTFGQLDFSDVTLGDWPVDNAVHDGAAGVWGLVAKGKVTVATNGTYSFAIGVEDGGRLRIDKDKNGFSNADNVIVDDVAGTHRARYGNVQLNAGTYDFEVTSFNSGGGGDIELSVSTKAGGGDTTAINSGSWELLGQTTGAVALQGSIDATSYMPSGPPDQRAIPLLVLLNGPEEGGRLFGGGPFVGADGTNFWAGAALNKFNGGSPNEPSKAVQLKPVDVAGKQNLKLTIAVAGTFLDFETDDHLIVLIDPNNSGTFTQLMFFTAPSGNDKYFDDRTTKPNSPTRLGLRFQDVTYDLPAGASQLVVRIEGLWTWWNEITAFDNIRITEGAIATRPTFEPPTITGGSVRISWTGGGHLQEASNLTGSANDWTSVTGDPPSPFLVTPGTAPRKFYRLVFP